MSDQHEALRQRALSDTWQHFLRAQDRLEAAERARGEAERERVARMRTLNDPVSTKEIAK